MISMEVLLSDHQHLPLLRQQPLSQHTPHLLQKPTTSRQSLVRNKIIKTIRKQVPIFLKDLTGDSILKRLLEVLVPNRRLDHISLTDSDRIDHLALIWGPIFKILMKMRNQTYSFLHSQAKKLALKYLRKVKYA